MNHKITPFGYFLITTFFILLSYAGWIYAKSIDWDVLKRLESAPLSIPSPSTSTPTPITTTVPSPQK